MPRSHEFDIAFAGLKDGIHEFNFHVDGSFFEQFQPLEFNDCNVEVAVELTKSSTMLVLTFELKGTVVFPCDRCLDDVTLPVAGNHKLIAKFGADELQESEDVIVLAKNEYKIALSQYIYEFITLSFPPKKVHEEGKCNTDVIRKLEELAVAENSTADQRWKALKKLNISS